MLIEQINDDNIRNNPHRVQVMLEGCQRGTMPIRLATCIGYLSILNSTYKKVHQAYTPAFLVTKRVFHLARHELNEHDACVQSARKHHKDMHQEHCLPHHVICISHQQITDVITANIQMTENSTQPLRIIVK